MTVVHGSHAQSVPIDASVDRVWDCFAVLDLRHRWFRVPGPRDASEHTLDFRVGGMEVTRGAFTALDTSEQIETRTRFVDIVPLSRIITEYELDVDRPGSVSLITVLFTAVSPTETQVDYHEQYTFMDPVSPGAAIEIREREGGTRLMLNGLKGTAESDVTGSE